jgi:arylsulfatase A-like enzyme
MPGSETSSRPNVLVIYTDDQPQEWVGCYDGNVLTPNIDRIAEEGMRFDRYYASSPVCSPSRYSALTGRYASRSERFQRDCPPGTHPVVGWNAGAAGETNTLASVLSENGYTTGFVGKWHQGVDDDIESVASDADGRDPETAAVIEDNYARLVAQVERCGFDDARHVYPANVFGWELPESMERHNMEWVTQGALDFVDANNDQPFCLMMAPTLPHDPWEREQLESDPHVTPSGYLEERPDVQPSRRSVLRRVNSAPETSRPPTDAEHPDFMSSDEVQMGRAFATWLDDGVGAVLDALEAHGIAENTLVIFTSDHGNKGKFTCYDAGARQPCLVRWPDTLEPSDPCRDLVSNVDLAPTIFDVAGVDPSSEYTLDGRSFAPLITGSGEYQRDSLFLEITTERAVVTDDGYKYIAVRYPPEIQQQVDDGYAYQHRGRPVTHEGARYGADTDFPAYFEQDQLYDLVADPSEQNNLANDSAHADRLEALREEIRAYSADLPHAFGEFT